VPLDVGSLGGNLHACGFGQITTYILKCIVAISSKSIVIYLFTKIHTLLSHCSLLPWYFWDRLDGKNENGAELEVDEVRCIRWSEGFRAFHLYLKTGKYSNLLLKKI
jgi:hypothetical protein